jgi:hypothetical protein
MFNLKKSENELSGFNSLSSQERYQQYTPSRDVTGANCPNGSIHIPFQTSGLTWWNPSKSYLRFRVKLTKNGTDRLTVGDNIGPNMNLCANLFQSMEFRVGGSNMVSQISSFVPQIDALQTRMSKSKAWLDSIGASTNFTQADLNSRVNEVSSNGRFVSERQPLGETVTNE